jgi:hypothetical protein
MQRLAVFVTGRLVRQLFPCKDGVVLDRFRRLVQTAQVDACPPEPPLVMVCLLLRLGRRMGDFSGCGLGVRGRLPLVKVLEEVARVALSGRLFEQAGQLVALGALSFLRDVPPAIAARLGVASRGGREGVCGACSTTGAYVIEGKKWLCEELVSGATSSGAGATKHEGSGRALQLTVFQSEPLVWALQLNILHARGQLRIHRGRSCIYNSRRGVTVQRIQLLAAKIPPFR